MYLRGGQITSGDESDCHNEMLKLLRFKSFELVTLSFKNFPLSILI